MLLERFHFFLGQSYLVFFEFTTQSLNKSNDLQSISNIITELIEKPLIHARCELK